MESFLYFLSCSIEIDANVTRLEHAYYLNTSEDHLKTIIGCYELSFFMHILQAMYIFVYEKINQNKLLSGSTQY